MNPTFSAFNKRINDQVTDIYARPHVVAATVALAISRLLPIPSAPVEDYSNFYTTQALPTARTLVDQFNSGVIIDCKQVLELTRQFWNLRYNAAHPLILGFATTKYGFFDTIIGVGLFVSEEAHCMLNEHKDKILLLAGEVANVFATELARNPYEDIGGQPTPASQDLGVTQTGF